MSSLKIFRDQLYTFYKVYFPVNSYYMNFNKYLDYYDNLNFNIANFDDHVIIGNINNAKKVIACRYGNMIKFKTRTNNQFNINELIKYFIVLLILICSLLIDFRIIMMLVLIFWKIDYEVKPISIVMNLFLCQQLAKQTHIDRIAFVFYKRKFNKQKFSIINNYLFIIEDCTVGDHMIIRNNLGNDHCINKTHFIYDESLAHDKSRLMIINSSHFKNKRYLQSNHLKRKDNSINYANFKRLRQFLIDVLA